MASVVAFVVALVVAPVVIRHICWGWRYNTPLRVFFSDLVYFPCSRQAVVTGVVSPPPPVRAFILITRRVRFRVPGARRFASVASPRISTLLMLLH